MTTAEQIILTSRPAGTVSLDNFASRQTELPGPAQGQILIRLIWMSLDPYMRGRMDNVKSYIPPFEINAPLEAGAVGEVIQSQNDHYTKGDLVMGMLPWASHAVHDGKGLRKLDPSMGPLQASLGALGMPGMTAWAGLTQVAAAKPGDTVLISAATGAVGSVAGQLAKAKGMTVLGVAGGAEKCAYAVDELGYDACFDHYAPNARDLSGMIREAAPQGVDVYFENVGGKTLQAVLPRMNDFGRVALCGMIAWYDGKGLEDAMALPLAWRIILTRRLRVQGFIVTDFQDQTKEFVSEVAPLLMSGKIKQRESVAQGLSAAPEAFISMLTGGNFGKQLVRIGEAP